MGAMEKCVLGKVVSDYGALESKLRNSGLMGQQKGDPQAISREGTRWKPCQRETRVADATVARNQV